MGGEAETDPSAGGNPSSTHYRLHIEPTFRHSQSVAFRLWRGGAVPVPVTEEMVEAARIEGTLPMVQWSVSPGCVGATAIRDWSTVGDVDVLQRGSGVYGQKLPETFGGPFSWAGQFYTERSVLATLLHDVIVSGNEGVLTRGCDVFVPHYDIEVPWYQNLPPPVPPEKPAYWLPAALWMVVMYPANFYSFLVDSLSRLAAWLVVRRERVPLLMPADAGALKTFMYDWLTVLGGFDIVPYDIRSRAAGASLAEARFVVRKLYVVDWRTLDGEPHRSEAILLPPRWALSQLRHVVVGQMSRLSVSGGSRVLLWIQRETATTRRVANEALLLDRVRTALHGDWTIKIFSDTPVPPAVEAVRLFQEADIVLGVHGSGQANIVFCRAGTGVIDINLPEPHSQYTAHTSYALGLRYRLVMLQGDGLHQVRDLTLPVDDVLGALRSLL